MKIVQVAVAVIIIKDGKVLLGKRRGAHGEGTWAFPGGHLEYFEDLESCAKREVLEETGLRIKNLRMVGITNDIFKEEDKHYITIYFVAEPETGEPEVKEPDKCEAWEWFEWDKLPEPLFLPIRNLLKTDFNPFSGKFNCVYSET